MSKTPAIYHIASKPMIQESFHFLLIKRRI